MCLLIDRKKQEAELLRGLRKHCLPASFLAHRLSDSIINRGFLLIIITQKPTLKTEKVSQDNLYQPSSSGNAYEDLERMLHNVPNRQLQMDGTTTVMLVFRHYASLPLGDLGGYMKASPGFSGCYFTK